MGGSDGEGFREIEGEAQTMALFVQCGGQCGGRAGGRTFQVCDELPEVPAAALVQQLSAQKVGGPIWYGPAHRHCTALDGGGEPRPQQHTALSQPIAEVSGEKGGRNGTQFPSGRQNIQQLDHIPSPLFIPLPCEGGKSMI
jgi:hypothetical protein